MEVQRFGAFSSRKGAAGSLVEPCSRRTPTIKLRIASLDGFTDTKSLSSDTRITLTNRLFFCSSDLQLFA